MDAVWGHGPHIQILHPSNNCIAGREAVMESWKAILASVRPRAFRIDLEDIRCLCVEGCVEGWGYSRQGKGRDIVRHGG